MTGREIYIAVLAEKDKTTASDFTLDEFNYILNSVIISFVNERYQVYDRDQQSTDDLRFLTKTAIFNNKLLNDDNVSYRLDPTYNKISGALFNEISAGSTVIEVSTISDLQVGSKIKFNSANDVAVYTVSAINSSHYPYQVTLTSALVNDLTLGTPIYIETPYIELTDSGTFTDFKATLTLPASDYLHLTSCRTCWRGKKRGQVARIVYPAKRLTRDILNVIQNNVYARPSVSSPYFEVKDNAFNSGVSKLDLDNYRAHQNRPTIDVLVGREKPNIQLDYIELTYIKMPEPVIIDDIDINTAGADNSQVLEFPDHLKPHLVKTITTRLQNIAGDPRLATQIQTNNTGIPPIGVPQQQPTNNKQ